MRKIWNIKPCDKKLRENLSRELNISPILAAILINRNLTDKEEARFFLYGDMKNLYDPFLLKGMEEAAIRIKKAVTGKEKILIYGDYDVDGITSAALLKIILDELGADAQSHIPNRLEEGYGLNEDAIKKARANGVKLIVTVDCGIGAVEEVKLANSLGMDVIITDHHEIKKDELPPAFAVINPRQKGCAYPFKHLAGVGLAYKLAQALMKKRYYPLEKHLDLVALGTVADVAPMKSENRIFTKHGIEALNATEKLGLRSLINISGIKNVSSSSHIGFILGPRINAMGRMGSADIALRLLLTDNKLEADKLAAMLSKENRNRQNIESSILEEAISKVEREVNFKDQRVIVLAGEGWHRGVIGIAASRIQERFYRPAILIALKGNEGKGSGRSIDGFHLFDALMNCKSFLSDFGGHEAACGLSIPKKNVAGFRDAINDYAREKIKDTDLVPSIDIDVEAPLSDLSGDIVDEIDLLEPFGPENRRPLFMSPAVNLRNEPRLIGKNGFKMLVSSGSVTCEAVSFKRDTMDVPLFSETIDIVYSPAINTWQGINSIQLDLRDIKIRR